MYANKSKNLEKYKKSEGSYNSEKNGNQIISGILKELERSMIIVANSIEKTKDCLIRAEDRLVVGIGLKDILIIETNDVLLVANKDNSQEIKNIVAKLKEQGISEGIEHKKIFRPWGFYISVVNESRWKVKLIQVKPGQQLSLQMHHHRSEHWIIVKGTAKVEIDDKEMILCENKSCFIPIGSKHRLSNPGKIPLKIIEVQNGSYVGEDDIERFEDNYGRLKNKSN